MSLKISISRQLDSFSLQVDVALDAGITAIFGPSGAGKTSIIQAVAGIMKPEAGHISSDGTVFYDGTSGVNLPVHKRRIGYVFQDHRLFPHMTVSENLFYSLRARGLPQKADRFDHIVALLGIGHLLKRYPAALSGGEKQRVAIGRALLSDPKVLLLDEPLASLDQARRQEILPYLERLRDTTKIPILYVSHDISEVARLANQVLLLDQGQQKRLGPIDEIFSDPNMGAILGQDNLGAVVFAKVMAHHEDEVTELSAAGGTLFLPRTDAKVGEIQRVRIRAQDVMLSLTRPKGVSALNVLEGKISDIATQAGVLVQITCGSDQVLARITKRSLKELDLHIGQSVFAVIKTVSVARGDVGHG